MAGSAGVWGDGLRSCGALHGWSVQGLDGARGGAAGRWIWGRRQPGVPRGTGACSAGRPDRRRRSTRTRSPTRAIGPDKVTLCRRGTTAMSEAMGAMSGVRRSPPGAGCPPGLPRRHPGAADPVTPVWTRGGGTWSRLLRRRVRAEPAVTDLGAHPLPWLAGFLRVTGDGGGIAAPSREGRRDAGGLRSLGATRGARELARWMLEAAVRSIGRRPSGCLRRAARTHWAVPRPQAVGSFTSLTELPAARLVTGRPPTDQRTGPRCAGASAVRRR